MALLDLPYELLDLICEAVFDDEDESEARVERLCSPSLLSICLSCHTLEQPARTWLFREARLLYPSKRAYQLLRTLRASPAYGKNIQHLYIWKKGDSYTGRPDDLTFLFSTLSNLRELYAPMFPPHVLQELILSVDVQCEKSLEYLCLDGSTCTVRDLFRLLAFPNLRRFTLFTFNDAGCETKELRHLSLSNLTSMNMISGQLGQPLFDSIISQCSRLEQIQCLVPLPCAAESVVDDTNETWTGARISVPAPISMYFAASQLGRFKDTLKDLNILTTRQTWEGHDGSRLDFHDFSCLHTLSISSSCFFAPRCLPVERRGFSRLLPASLEHLNITWGIETGIFFRLQGNGWLIYEQLHSFKTREVQGLNDHTWIQELALNKLTHLPKLELVEFHEDMVMPDGSAVFDLEEWDRPKEIKDLFASAGIELKVSYRSARSAW